MSKQGNLDITLSILLQGETTATYRGSLYRSISLSSADNIDSPSGLLPATEQNGANCSGVFLSVDVNPDWYDSHSETGAGDSLQSELDWSAG